MTLSHSSAPPPAELGAAGRPPPDRTPAAPTFSGKVRPILFSETMVSALLGGRKTQTRRVLKAPSWSTGMADFEEADNGVQAIGKESGCFFDVPLRYAVGDRLWVRETWTARMTHGWTIADARSRMYQEEILYYADHYESIDGWWPSIHMPREFSRLTLAVTEVRVQRLQDISEADAIAEGVTPQPHHSGRWIAGEDGWSFPSARNAYAVLWNGINAKRGFGWDTNPWVVAIRFTVHHCNIDDMAP